MSFPIRSRYLALGFLLLIVAAAVQVWERSRPHVHWTMINVNSKTLQGDAHLLQFPGGKNFLIDAGDNDNVLVPYLRRKKIHSLDKILISHGHRDHYGGLFQLLDAHFPIREVRWILPLREVCDGEKPWGCNWEEILALTTKLKAAQIPIFPEQVGDIYFQDGSIKLEVLYAFDGLHTPVGKTDVNDMSVILKLKVGETTALFTGDLNSRIGGFLAKEGKNLKADILKVPHHGADSVAPNSFFDVVNPTTVLVPAPRDLWLSARDQRVRQYWQDKKIPVYVNGMDGHVHVRLKENGFRIRNEQ